MWYMMEVENINSFTNSKELKATNPTSAKREASRKQVFCGTVLYVGTKIDENGWVRDAEFMKKDGEWYDYREELMREELGID